MIITARYSSVCPVCSSRIEPGAQVDWSRGAQATHLGCVRGASTTRSSTIETERQAWGRARGMGPGHGSAAAMPGYSGYCTDNDSCRCYDCAS